jgi:nitroimidazol reductase NimA-like FMN-containing flavoprotein (pyridoxamine 5'-phosphate oxidase superfamily)
MGKRHVREVTPEILQELLDRAEVAHLGTIDPDGRPYVVPVNFACLEGRLIYIHGAGEGRKIDNIRRDPRVCLEATASFEVRHGENSCATGARFESVILRGQASVVEDPAVAEKALDAIVAKYAPRHLGTGYRPEPLAATTVIAIDIDIASSALKAR